MSQDYGERLAKVEGRMEDVKVEVERVRQRQHDLTESIGIISSQVATIGTKVDGLISNSTLIAESAAQKVLTAYLATKVAAEESNTRNQQAVTANNVSKALIAALGLVVTVLGLKVGKVF